MCCGFCSTGGGAFRRLFVTAQTRIAVIYPRSHVHAAATVTQRKDDLCWKSTTARFKVNVGIGNLCCPTSVERRRRRVCCAFQCAFSSSLFTTTLVLDQVMSAFLVWEKGERFSRVVFLGEGYVQRQVQQTGLLLPASSYNCNPFAHVL